MNRLIVTAPSGHSFDRPLAPDRPTFLGRDHLSLGRGGGPHPLLPRRWIALHPEPGGYRIERLDGDGGEPLRLRFGQRAAIGGFSVQVLASEVPEVDGDALLHGAADRLHGAALAGLGPSVDFGAEPRSAVVREAERAIVRAARLDGWVTRAAEVRHAAGRAVRDEAVDRLLGAPERGPAWRRPAEVVPAWEKLLDRLADEATALASGVDPATRLASLNQQFDAWWAGVAVADRDLEYLALRHAAKVVKEMLFGYGPLEDLLALEVVSEVMIVPPRRVFVEIDGRLVDTGRRFPTDGALRHVIERIVDRAGTRIDLASPTADARLTDGSRVNAVLPPIAVDGDILTIRKFPTRRWSMADLVGRGVLPADAARLLQAGVTARLNVVVAGGTGTGKTTILNVLSDSFGPADRVVTVEDTAELRPSADHLVRLEARTANTEGTGQVSIRDLVRNSLRMRPDRIVVGEVRGPEALDMLGAMSTGHEGSLTTIHANGAGDALRRLELLAQQGGEVPLRSIRELIASSVHLIVQLGRDHGGLRRVREIVEVLGLDGDGTIRTKPIFACDPDQADRLRPTGLVPSCFGRLLADGGLSLQDFFEGEEP
jgi:Flp pilus assembly CpaF family ATPase